MQNFLLIIENDAEKEGTEFCSNVVTSRTNKQITSKIATGLGDTENMYYNIVFILHKPSNKN